MMYVMYAPDRRAGKIKPNVVSPIVLDVFGVLHQSSPSWGTPLPARQIHFEENENVKISLKQITIRN